MKIPGDTGHPWRLNKFVEYQHYALAVDPPTYGEYAKRRNLTPDDCIVLAWYHSLTYCELTAALLFNKLPWKTIQSSTVKEFWKDNKGKLIFQSARMYVKNMDWFVPLMNQFMRDCKRQPYEWLKRIALPGTPKARYKAVYDYLMKWKYMGRFSVDLFLEALITFNQIGLLPLALKVDKYDWKNCSNLTSGLLNILYRDKEADEFDKTQQLSNSLDLDTAVLDIYKEVMKKYPEQDTNIVSVVNKICSFRNLFKASRYGGFHHDRQLANLYTYQKVYPDCYLWKEFFKIRKDVFAPQMLGELGGWTGIRKERKKLWLEKGLTGVEVTG
jgi:hypothetical protein